jgi:hypothetical protein
MTSTTTAPPTTYNTGPVDAGGYPTGTDAPPAPTDTPGTTTTTFPHRDPHPTGQETVSCSGPANGPYTAQARLPWTDGTDETGSGTFADYGQHSIPGNRGDVLYVYIGPPPVGVDPPYCVPAGWTGPP